ncbi:hypothetical protein [Anatilimnocola floriformis]|uniref:hypothetical protein n=1 Tax=Anatilimnocola floriformis TaxID=2948575 RepID=UPI0020C1C1F5|nr:hypothetical protein [Anatilimnocola floriformis]
MKASFPSVISMVLVFVAAAPVLFALPPIDKEWKERYIEKNPPPAYKEDAATQKCNVCHEPGGKKAKNEYGKAVGKHLKKADIDALKGNPPAMKKLIQDALEKAESEKNEKGEKFGDIMKNGKLPGSK